MPEILIVGAGAAGLMAALFAGRAGARVTVLERNEKPGKKIYITGKGHCNCTNDCEREDFLREVPRNPRFLYSALSGFTPQDLMGLLEENKDRMENINLIMANDEKRLRWLAEIKKLPGVTACSSTPDNIEIGGLNTSKADALIELAAYLGMDKDSIMAFGDSSNDEQMVIRSGIGVAMGNSVPELLDVADYIAPTNEDDGVAYTLEHLLGI